MVLYVTIYTEKRLICNLSFWAGGIMINKKGTWFMGSFIFVILGIAVWYSVTAFGIFGLSSSIGNAPRILVNDQFVVS